MSMAGVDTWICAPIDARCVLDFKGSEEEVNGEDDNVQDNEKVMVVHRTLT